MRQSETSGGGTESNRVDAAIGGLSSDVEFQPEVCQIGRIMGIGEAVEGMDVCKHGRTTGYTEGTVTDESYDALIGMDHSDPNVVALFENQVRIERTPPYLEIGLGRDSGSLVFSKAKAEAVGLYFANPPSGSFGVVNHIADVLSELQIELLKELILWESRWMKFRRPSPTNTSAKPGSTGWELAAPEMLCASTQTDPLGSTTTIKQR